MLATFSALTAAVAYVVGRTGTAMWRRLDAGRSATQETGLNAPGIARVTAGQASNMQRCDNITSCFLPDLP